MPAIGSADARPDEWSTGTSHASQKTHHQEPFMDYKSAGVDVEAGRAFVSRIRSIVESTYRPEVVGELGGGNPTSTGRRLFRSLER